MTGTAVTERECIQCGAVFTGQYRKCRACRPYYTDRQCAECGSAFRGETLKCSACQRIERQCTACGAAFTGRYHQCENCRRPPKPCLVPGCTNPKLPGPGSKVCQQHRDDAGERKAQRAREQNLASVGTCQMTDCGEPKLRGHGHKYCARHSAEGRQRERAQIVRRKREREFGVTHVQFLAMLEEQGGVCAICGNRNDVRQLSVDHDHVTGVVRGLLCDRCNPMLGYAHDNIAVLRTAIEYLIRYSIPGGYNA